MQAKTQALVAILAAATLSCSGCHGWPRAIRGTVPASVSPARFLPRGITLRRAARRFTVYLPPGYTSSSLWPVILSLHGSGDCGADGVKPSEAGIGEALRRLPERFPCIVVFPQTTHALRYWTDDQDMALAELARAVQEFHGDRQRLYLTGYSLGGSGTWFLAARNPGKFAAVVPICVRIAIEPSRARDQEVYKWVTSRDPFAATASRIARLPVWVFHGADDPIVPVSESRRIVSALRSRGGDVRFTELAQTGHGAWVRAYADPNLPRWLLSHRLSR